MKSPTPTPNVTDPAVIARNLDRITALQLTDPGLFVLAVHSFVEGWIRERFGLGMDLVTFATMMNHFIDYAKKKSGGYVPGLSALNAMITAHDDTHPVRHRFADLDRNAVEMATQHLDRFCFLAALGNEQKIANLKGLLEHWGNRKPVPQLLEENQRLSILRGKESEERKRLIERVAELEGLNKKVEVLEADLSARVKRIEELEGIASARGEKAERERKERSAIEQELKATKKQVEGYARERDYVALIKRMTAYTRTRADYERMMIRLSPEQLKVLDLIRLDKDFLVKGAAGTGKTLVLLKAIEKVKTGGRETRLGIDELSSSVALLTYTNTLVKYDSYIASILSANGGADRVSTADSFIKERIAAIDPGAAMDYDIVHSLAGRYKVEGYEAEALADEAEKIIWGNDLSYARYVDEGFERRGMKRPIPPKERAKFWAATEAMAAEMEAANRYSKGYSRIKLLRAVDADPNDPRIRCMDFVFVDEAQDLSTADLKALKACARVCVIMAGDADQAIFQPGFTFRDAGVDIVGHTRILRSNYRNTMPIHDLAEAYRAKVPGQDVDSLPTAVRPGPLPELIQGANRDELLSLIRDRARFYVNDLGYDPENLCVLSPLGKDVDFVVAGLETAGIAAIDIRSKEFDFATQGSMRVSTFQSAKGLDFPVVLLFLYRRPWLPEEYGKQDLELMTRNLVYVGTTRAMDHLDVFITSGTTDPVLTDLVEAFAEAFTELQPQKKAVGVSSR